MKIPEYRSIIDLKIQHSPDLPSKRLEAQFRKLIIEPFLELTSRNVCVQDKTVIINGLDEYNEDLAQGKIMELVTKSVIEHGDKIPLLWAFFSRPELRIYNAFLPHLDSYLLSKVELLVSESDDSDIKRYFCEKLRPPTYVNTQWPLENTFDILVMMAAGLWIYAATLVRFIMDPDLFPEQQLELVLTFHSQREKRMQPNTEPNITGELDAFYLMIISRIPPEHLPMVQQALLVYHTNLESHSHISMFQSSSTKPEIQLYVLANILGHSLASLKLALSKLYSIVTFISEKERLGSAISRI